MKHEENQFLIEYEERLMSVLLNQISDGGLLEGELLAVEELDEKWNSSAASYMAAAVPQLNEYPAAAIAWAAYFGIGAAVIWDTEWVEKGSIEDFYPLIAEPRGFDEMDEYVIESMLGYSLESQEAIHLENVLRGAATSAISMIRKENVESQSVMAFYVFARSAKVFYKLGVAIALRKVGYRYHKVVAGVN